MFPKIGKKQAKRKAWEGGNVYVPLVTKVVQFDVTWSSPDIQVCPTSSVYTNSARHEDHAVQRFAADGVSFSLNTDDPGVIECDLTGEFDVAEKKIGLTKEQLMQSVSWEEYFPASLYDYVILDVT